jgi:hypothetical protein
MQYETRPRELRFYAQAAGASALILLDLDIRDIPNYVSLPLGTPASALQK